MRLGSLFIAVIFASLLLVETEAQSLELRFREAGSGLQFIDANPTENITIDVLLDTQGVALGGLQINFAWDAEASSPVLGGVGFIANGVFGAESITPVTQSAVGSEGSVAYVGFDATGVFPVNGSSLLIGQVTATVIGGLGQDTSLTVLGFFASDANSTPVSGGVSGAAISVVPEPSTALLVGLGLAGLAGVRRRN